MKIRMTNRRFTGVANVLPDDQAKWEAAGWVAEQKPALKASKKTSKDKEK